MNFFQQFRDASRANGVILEGQMVDPESVSWKCQPLHCFTFTYPSPHDSGEGEDHAAPQPQWPVHVDVAAGHGGKKREREDWSDKAQVGRTSPDAPQCQKNSEEKSSDRAQAHHPFFVTYLHYNVSAISADIP